jgi:hypothetical protein
MMNGFVWPLNKAGHEVSNQEVVKACFTAYIDESVSSESQWIRPVGGKKRWYRYAPLHSNTALFRTFIDLDGGSQSIVDFANRFGLLTNPEEGEPLALWKAAVAEMRSAVANWESLVVHIDGIDELEEVDGVNGAARPARSACNVQVRGDVGIGETRVRVQGDGEMKAARPADDVVACRDLESGKTCFSAGSFKAATSVTPAHDFPFVKVIGFRCDATKFAAFAERWKSFLLDINKNVSHVRPIFHYCWMEDRLRLELMPPNLLEAMWLQFGQAVESNKSFRKCRACGTWFEISPKTARSDKVFCSGACKAKAYRQRQGKVKVVDVPLDLAGDKVSGIRIQE